MEHTRTHGQASKDVGGLGKCRDTSLGGAMLCHLLLLITRETASRRQKPGTFSYTETHEKLALLLHFPAALASAPERLGLFSLIIFAIAFLSLLFFAMQAHTTIFCFFSHATFLRYLYGGFAIRSFAFCI